MNAIGAEVGYNIFVKGSVGTKGVGTQLRAFAKLTAGAQGWIKYNLGWYNYTDYWKKDEDDMINKEILIYDFG